ncbi:MAG: type II secretion system protein GspK, partial [Gammaproteobacteria bacterium]
EREDEAYSSVEEFVERLQLPIDIEGLSVNTKFFRAHGQVVQGEQVFNLNTLVYRDEKGRTSIFNRSLGVF